MLKTIKKTLKKYKFDNNDISALLTFFDTMFTIVIGLGFAWVGVAIGCVDLYNDIKTRGKINKYVKHISKIVVNLYLVWCSYKLK